MQSYDPEREPDPHRWLSLDEEARYEAVLSWHRAHAPGPEPEEGWSVHSALHAQVETRVAEGGPEAAKLRELVLGGLRRHEAVHAIAWVRERLVEETLTRGAAARSLASLLDALTVTSWQRTRAHAQARASSHPDRSAAARRRRSQRKAQRRARKRGRR